MEEGLTVSQLRMLKTLQEYLPLEVPDNLKVEIGGEGISIRRSETETVVVIQEERLFPRALSLLQDPSLGRDSTHTEKPCYTDLSFMSDVARNAVPKLPAFKRLISMLACMGYNSIQVYLEDIFEMKDYPYFGYLRGRYTEAELRELDDFADGLGLELVPSIQTLAHLDKALRWDVMKTLVDIDGIVLVGDSGVYKFVESMFETMSRCFRSRTINLGMDEAHMLGLGRYLLNNGYVNRTEVMLRHITQVTEIATRFGYSPMMWSDMFFRLATGGEYDSDGLTEEQIARVRELLPENLGLVYWNYYSLDKGIYDSMLKAHLQMSPNILFAPGAWKWTGFHPTNAHGMNAGYLAHQSCLEHGISKIVLTSWGDNGGEASMFSTLPTIQMWAELCFCNTRDPEWLARRVSACCNVSYEDLMAMDEPVYTPGNPAPGEMGVNAPKALLYQDVLLGLFDVHVDADTFAPFFARCASAHFEIAERLGESSYVYPMFKASAALCSVLELKCRAGIDLRKAYGSGSFSDLTRYVDLVLPELLARLEKFVDAYHKQWLSESKAAGLDMFDIKLGATIQRVKTARERVAAYLNGEIERIEELEYELLPYDGKEVASPPKFNLQHAFWHNLATPGLIHLI